MGEPWLSVFLRPEIWAGAVEAGLPALTQVSGLGSRGHPQLFSLYPGWAALPTMGSGKAQ